MASMGRILRLKPAAALFLPAQCFIKAMSVFAGDADSRAGYSHIEIGRTSYPSLLTHAFILPGLHRTTPETCPAIERKRVGAWLNEISVGDGPMPAPALPHSGPSSTGASLAPVGSISLSVDRH